MAKTHISKMKGYVRVAAAAPSSPQDGERYFDRTLGALGVYNASAGKWHYAAFTSTSSSSSTTVSTSSSTTSTSSSTTVSTSTSSSTSTSI